ncbi:proton-translocating NAD(P)(+) transhydrogenase OS=Tsukamurella paurometabola (strain ATCC 8368 /DSM / CCUG 35730 / CIP 100753 / JCM 10117 / KCTC 9821/ NBRC 16120 / NCIMB 702349 / NCTC 13040) OX=521096 GN=Tpau_0191 PE=3 SV=1 [Tsukamurella paurometabola]|uniref:NAD(P) transhydrogenase subunit alpha n=1 Tax=Tsukamurella paurometabola (strain ATCC 8368 / DSM 20162 / CCUG 35730 / CIP 100753 / JCM 10117 / KCTC 9821 / NBRC 16120 / NCIMB 702349 / NCTC 13040) TaxID=521096 RepID=D5UQL2_TSUPD|nr:Re/Si-specific NAD(P)(+) transhydrogenase subunit alpha [Tsukamurella paurometabola]ADG76845.1 NAD(P) transhydrogenase, alpha subunit [Tsukamurella paurometabola DSM 20162]SUP41886.1 NAD(P) transhydrogenase subunit alpha [Tsukamurella paurometabola]
MIIGVLKEAQPGETRAAGTPTTVAQLIKLGYQVVVDSGAGEASSFSDDAYVEAGASIGDARAADVVLGVNAPSAAQLDGIRPGASLVSILAPGLNPDLLADLRGRGITALAMDAVPRISRAQSMDVLSSMANIAGYRAVVEAAHVFGRFFTGQVTAAGKVPPAKVLIVGAGVAGLAAIGAAGSLGAIVRATDPRPEVADQVASLGGEYLSIADEESEVSATGYAKEMDDDYKAREAQLYADQCKDVDIIVTTALIPGRPAPRIITEEMVASMKPGSVIVDMAAQNGGNVAGTVKDQAIVTENGVTIIGYTDLAGRLPAQASQLYGTNVVNLLKLLTPEKDGELVLDFEDPVQRSITVTRDGEILWPPPAVSVSAAPQAAPAAQAQAQPEKQPMATSTKVGLTLFGIALLFVVNAFAPDPIPRHFTVLVLAIVIGYYVIGKVHHALHTPLMSVTNAISGVIVVGAIIQVGLNNTAIQALAGVAILLASINVFGGFAVTRRMLTMFSKGA